MADIDSTMNFGVSQPEAEYYKRNYHPSYVKYQSIRANQPQEAEENDIGSNITEDDKSHYYEYDGKIYDDRTDKLAVGGGTLYNDKEGVLGSAQSFYDATYAGAMNMFGEAAYAAADTFKSDYLKNLSNDMHEQAQYHSESMDVLKGNNAKFFWASVGNGVGSIMPELGIDGLLTLGSMALGATSTPLAIAKDAKDLSKAARIASKAYSAITKAKGTIKSTKAVSKLADFTSELSKTQLGRLQLARFLASPIESASEAGSVLRDMDERNAFNEQLIAQGKEPKYHQYTDDEREAAKWETFAKNFGYLTLMNAVQFAGERKLEQALNPLIKGATKEGVSAVSKAGLRADFIAEKIPATLRNMGLVAGERMLIHGPTEGAEEIGQNYIHDSAMGDKFNWEQAKLEGKMGAIGGAVLGGIGGAVSLRSNENYHYAVDKDGKTWRISPERTASDGITKFRTVESADGIIHNFKSKDYKEFAKAFGLSEELSDSYQQVYMDDMLTLEDGTTVPITTPSREGKEGYMGRPNLGLDEKTAERLVNARRDLEHSSNLSPELSDIIYNSRPSSAEVDQILKAHEDLVNNRQSDMNTRSEEEIAKARADYADKEENAYREQIREIRENYDAKLRSMDADSLKAQKEAENAAKDVEIGKTEERKAEEKAKNDKIIENAKAMGATIGEDVEGNAIAEQFAKNKEHNDKVVEWAKNELASNPNLTQSQKDDISDLIDAHEQYKDTYSKQSVISDNVKAVTESCKDIPSLKNILSSEGNSSSKEALSSAKAKLERMKKARAARKATTAKNVKADAVKSNTEEPTVIKTNAQDAVTNNAQNTATVQDNAEPIRKHYGSEEVAKASTKSEHDRKHFETKLSALKKSKSKSPKAKESAYMAAQMLKSSIRDEMEAIERSKDSMNASEKANADERLKALDEEYYSINDKIDEAISGKVSEVADETPEKAPETDEAPKADVEEAPKVQEAPKTKETPKVEENSDEEEPQKRDKYASLRGKYQNALDSYNETGKNEFRNICLSKGSSLLNAIKKDISDLEDDMESAPDWEKTQIQSEIDSLKKDADNIANSLKPLIESLNKQKAEKSQETKEEPQGQVQEEVQQEKQQEEEGKEAPQNNASDDEITKRGFNPNLEGYEATTYERTVNGEKFLGVEYQNADGSVKINIVLGKDGKYIANGKIDGKRVQKYNTDLNTLIDRVFPKVGNVHSAENVQMPRASDIKKGEKITYKEAREKAKKNISDVLPAGKWNVFLAPLATSNVRLPNENINWYYDNLGMRQTGIDSRVVGNTEASAKRDIKLFDKLVNLIQKDTGVKVITDPNVMARIFNSGKDKSVHHAKVINDNLVIYISEDDKFGQLCNGHTIISQRVIFVNAEAPTLDTPIHEYSHLLFEALKVKAANVDGKFSKEEADKARGIVDAINNEMPKTKVYKELQKYTVTDEKGNTVRVYPDKSLVTESFARMSGSMSLDPEFTNAAFNDIFDGSYKPKLRRAFEKFYNWVRGLFGLKNVAFKNKEEADSELVKTLRTAPWSLLNGDTTIKDVFGENDLNHIGEQPKGKVKDDKTSSGIDANVHPNVKRPIEDSKKLISKGFLDGDKRSDFVKSLKNGKIAQYVMSRLKVQKDRPALEEQVKKYQNILDKLPSKNADYAEVEKAYKDAGLKFSKPDFADAVKKLENIYYKDNPDAEKRNHFKDLTYEEEHNAFAVLADIGFINYSAGEIGGSKIKSFSSKDAVKIGKVTRSLKSIIENPEILQKVRTVSIYGETVDAKNLFNNIKANQKALFKISNLSTEESSKYAPLYDVSSNGKAHYAVEFNDTARKMISAKIKDIEFSYVSDNEADILKELSDFKIDDKLIENYKEPSILPSERRSIMRSIKNVKEYIASTRDSESDIDELVDRIVSGETKGFGAFEQWSRSPKLRRAVTIARESTIKDFKQRIADAKGDIEKIKEVFYDYFTTQKNIRGFNDYLFANPFWDRMFNSKGFDLDTAIDTAARLMNSPYILMTNGSGDHFSYYADGAAASKMGMAPYTLLRIFRNNNKNTQELQDFYDTELPQMDLTDEERKQIEDSFRPKQLRLKQKGDHYEFRAGNRGAFATVSEKQAKMLHKIMALTGNDKYDEFKGQDDIRLFQHINGQDTLEKRFKLDLLNSFGVYPVFKNDIMRFLSDKSAIDASKNKWERLEQILDAQLKTLSIDDAEGSLAKAKGMLENFFTEENTKGVIVSNVKIEALNDFFNSLTDLNTSEFVKLAERLNNEEDAEYEDEDNEDDEYYDNEDNYSSVAPINSRYNEQKFKGVRSALSSSMVSSKEDSFLSHFKKASSLKERKNLTKQKISDLCETAYVAAIDKYDRLVDFDEYYDKLIDKINEAYERKTRAYIPEALSMHTRVQHATLTSAGIAKILGDGKVVNGKCDGITTLNELLAMKEEDKLEDIGTLRNVLAEGFNTLKSDKKIKLPKENGSGSDEITAQELVDFWGDGNVATFLGRRAMAGRLMEMYEMHRKEYIDRKTAAKRQGVTFENEDYVMPDGLDIDQIALFLRECGVDITESKDKHNQRMFTMDSSKEMFKDSMDAYKAVNRNIRKLLHSSNVLNSDALTKAEKEYPEYCPLVRDFRSISAAATCYASLSNGGTGVGNVTTSLKSISHSGSKKNVYNPIEVTLRSIAMAANRSVRNRTGKMIVDRMLHIRSLAVKAIADSKVSDEMKADLKAMLDDMPVKAEHIEVTDDGRIKDSNPNVNRSIFTVLYNGRAIPYSCKPEYYDAIVGYSDFKLGIVMSGMEKVASMLRNGATQTLSFITRNIWRDSFFASCFSDVGFKPWNSFTGLHTLLSNPEKLAETYALGIGQYNQYQDTDGIVESIEGIMDSYIRKNRNKPKDISDALQYVYDVIKDGAKMIWNATEVIGKYGELATRRGLMDRSDKVADKMDWSAMPILYHDDKTDTFLFNKKEREAALKSYKLMFKQDQGASGTLNFARNGVELRKWNRVIPFLNAGLQGSDMAATKLVYTRRYRHGSWLNNHWRYWMQTTMWGILPVLLSTVACLRAWPEKYKRVNSGIRYSCLLFPTNEKIAKETGIYFIRMPRMQEGQIVVGGPFQVALEKMFLDKPDLALSYFNEATKATAPDYMPTVLSILGQLSANYNAFSNRPILSERLKYLDPDLQYTTTTPEITRWASETWLGKKLGISPVISTLVVRDVWGTNGLAYLNGMSMALDNHKTNPSKKLSEVWPFRDFTTTFYNLSDNTNLFYRIQTVARIQNQSATERRTGLTHQGSKNLSEINSVGKQIAQWRKDIRLIHDMRRDGKNGSYSFKINGVRYTCRSDDTRRQATMLLYDAMDRTAEKIVNKYGKTYLDTDNYKKFENTGKHK